jgi:hypothetical protein
MLHLAQPSVCLFLLFVRPAAEFVELGDDWSRVIPVFAGELAVDDAAPGAGFLALPILPPLEPLQGRQIGIGDMAQQVVDQFPELRQIELFQLLFGSAGGFAGPLSAHWRSDSIRGMY